MREQEAERVPSARRASHVRAPTTSTATTPCSETQAHAELRAGPGAVPLTRSQLSAAAATTPTANATTD